MPPGYSVFIVHVGRGFPGGGVIVLFRRGVDFISEGLAKGLRPLSHHFIGSGGIVLVLSVFIRPGSGVPGICHRIYS